jgi:hypothetical protein
VDENGGFITTTVGCTSSGSTLLICSAFSVNTRASGSTSRSTAARRDDSSFSDDVGAGQLAEHREAADAGRRLEVGFARLTLATQFAM